MVGGQRPGSAQLPHLPVFIPFSFELVLALAVSFFRSALIPWHGHLPANCWECYPCIVYNSRFLAGHGVKFWTWRRVLCLQWLCFSGLQETFFFLRTLQRQSPFLRDTLLDLEIMVSSTAGSVHRPCPGKLRPHMGHLHMPGA